MDKTNITVTLPLAEFERLQNIEKNFNADKSKGYFIC